MLLDPLPAGFEFPIPDDRWWWLVYIPSRWVRRNSSRVPTFVATYSIKRGWIWCTRSSLQPKSSDDNSRWNFVCMFTFLLTKLPEDNVFSCVCVFPQGGGHSLYVTTTHDASTPRPNPPSSGSGTWWPRLEACSSLFTTGPLLVLASGGGHWNRYKRAVRILLECFLLVHRSVPLQAHFEFLFRLSLS